MTGAVQRRGIGEHNTVVTDFSLQEREHIRVKIRIIAYYMNLRRKELTMTREERNRYVVDNMRLIYSTLKPFRGMNNYDDLVQVGTLGMIESLDRMKGNEICTSYITSYIKGYVLKYINRIDVAIKPNARAKQGIDCGSLDNVLDDGTTFGDMMQDDNNMIDDVITICAYERMISKLSKKAQKPMRCLLSGYDTTDAAKICGLSYARVGQIKKMCDKKLVSA